MVIRKAAKRGLRAVREAAVAGGAPAAGPPLRAPGPGPGARVPGH